jgi:prepilin-type N-terminal cleavage/methylation domain-containing protein
MPWAQGNAGHPPSIADHRTDLGAWHNRLCGRGFTLIEMVLVLTLLAIVASLTIPIVSGLKEDELARKPMTELKNLAKEVRLRAMTDQRPYQIAFTSKGFTATRYLSPYMQASQIEEFLQKNQIEEDQKAEINGGGNGGNDDKDAPQEALPNPNAPNQPLPPAPAYKEWTKQYTLPENTHYSIQFWYELNPTPIDGDTVKLWVFQPSGIVIPMTIGLDRDSSHYDASFNALTADMIKQTSR